MTLHKPRSIRILHRDGNIEDVPRAITAEVKGKEVVCLDRKGVIVARYPSNDVTMFGPLDALDDADKDEGRASP